MAGYEVMPALEAAERGDIFVTVTGSRRVLRREHFERMKDGALLANAGHFDVELDLDELRALASGGVRQVRPLVEQYELADGRRLNLLAHGRVVNLAAAEGHPAAVMDVSFALQALCVEELVRDRDQSAAGVQPVPAEIDREVGRSEARRARRRDRRADARAGALPRILGLSRDRDALRPRRLRGSGTMPRAPGRTTTVKRLAGIDLGGTKIEAIIVDVRNTVLGSSRRPTPTTGGPPDVAAAMAWRSGGVRRGRRRRRRALPGVGVGSPGRSPTASRHVSRARNLPGGTEPFELGPTLAERARDAGVRRQRRPGRDRRRVRARRRPAVQVAARRVLGDRRRRRPDPRRQAVARPRRRRRDRPHGRQARNGARARAAGAGAWRPTRAAPRWRPSARGVDEGAKTDLFKLMEKHEQDRD